MTVEELTTETRGHGEGRNANPDANSLLLRDSVPPWLALLKHVQLKNEQFTGGQELVVVCRELSWQCGR